MPLRSRPLPVLAATAVAICAGAAPALASTGHASSPPTAQGPLTAKITSEASVIRLRYLGNGAQNPGPSTTPPVSPALQNAAAAVNRISVDSAQLTPKLEWVLGVYLEGEGQSSITNGQQAAIHGRIDGHPAGQQAIDAGTADWRLSNYLVAQADSTLGIAHPARNIEPEAPRRGEPIPSGPGAGPLSAPTGLAATIRMGEPALQEVIPSDVETAYVLENGAALRYYTTVVADMHVTGAQRVGRQDWLTGARTQLRGDELLSGGETTHTEGNPLTGNHEMRDALGILRQANSEIAHADSLLGVHISGSSATLPAHTTYYGG